MCGCDNGLKRDAVGFQCSSVPMLCLVFAIPMRKAIASTPANSIRLKMIFPEELEAVGELCIYSFRFFISDELAAGFRINETGEEIFFFHVYPTDCI